MSTTMLWYCIHVVVMLSMQSKDSLVQTYVWPSVCLSACVCRSVRLCVPGVVSVGLCPVSVFPLPVSIASVRAHTHTHTHTHTLTHTHTHTHTHTQSVEIPSPRNCDVIYHRIHQDGKLLINSAYEHFFSSTSANIYFKQIIFKKWNKINLSFSPSFLEYHLHSRRHCAARFRNVFSALLPTGQANRPFLTQIFKPCETPVQIETRAKWERTRRTLRKLK